MLNRSGWIIKMISSVLALVMWSNIAYAHSTATHRWVGDQAASYIESHAKLPNAKVKLSSGSAGPIATDEAKAIVEFFLNKVKLEGKESWLLFGIEPPAALGAVPSLSVWPPGTTQIDFKGSDFPGLYPVATDLTKQDDRVTLMGMLAEGGDKVLDTWVQVDDVFQTILTIADDKYWAGMVDHMKEAVNWAPDTFFHNADWQSCWDALGNGFWADLICGIGALFALIVMAIIEVGALIYAGIIVPLLAGVAYVFGAPEGIAEDTVMACHANPAFANDEPDPLWWSQSLRNTCDKMEESLEDIKQIRTSGHPDSEAELMRHIRGMMYGLFTRGQAIGHPDTWAWHLNDYFRQWRNSILPASTRVPLGANFSEDKDAFGTAEYGSTYEYFKLSTFGAQYHFLDLLSPEHGTPSFANVGTFLKTKGVYERWDGYSLEAGTVFAVPDGKGGSVTSPLDQGFALEKAKQFNAVMSPAESGNAWLRRRVGCPVRSESMNKDVTLSTTDGLGITDCKGTAPLEMLDAPLVAKITRPATNMALDGWAQWLSKKHPGVLRDRPGAPKDGDSLYRVVDRGKAYYDVYKAGNLDKTSKSNIGCASPPGDYSNAITCKKEDADTSLETQLAQGKHSSTAISGLSFAMHAVQDVTQPHHLGPTTGFGHSQYESFVRKRLLGATDGVYGTACAKGTTDCSNSVSLPITVLDASPMVVDESYFKLVSSKVAALEDTMSKLQQETASACKGFAMRRLVVAAAFLTGQALEKQAANFKKTGALAAPFWRPEFDDDGAMDAYNQLALKHTGKTVVASSGGFGLDVWKEIADETVPIAVAATVLLLKHAYLAREGKEELCDSGWGDGSTPPTPPPPPATKPGVDPGTCVTNKVAELLKSDPSLEQYMALAKARCLCAHKEPAAVAACYKFNVGLWGLMQSYDSGRIPRGAFAYQMDRATSARNSGKQRGDSSTDACRRDSDCDGVPDCVDKCPAERWCKDPVYGPPKSPPIDARGCSRLISSDGDSVWDANDFCPYTAAGESVDKRGCSNADYILR